MPLTELQKQFIWLAHGEQMKFSDIEKELKVSRAQLSEWDKELKKEWTEIAEIRKVYVQKNIKADFKAFYDWFSVQQNDKKCAYCGITEQEIEQAFADNKIGTKRGRGKKLELDRKEPESPYDNFDNIVYACYWCNNAKTDTFSHTEFLQVGKVLRSIWKERGVK